MSEDLIWKINHVIMTHSTSEAKKLLLESPSINLNVPVSCCWDSLAPLHVAAACLNVEIAEMLLERGSDVNLRSGNLYTPLHFMIGVTHKCCTFDLEKSQVPKKRMEMYELLMKHGAIIESNKYPNEEPPLEFAMREFGNDELELLKIMIDAQEDGANARFYQDTTLLIEAIWRDLDLIDFLLERGANVNSYNLGSTPLSLCLGKCLKGYLKDRFVIAQKLVDRGADVNADLNFGKILHKFVDTDRIDVVEWLIDRGANVNVSIKNDDNFFHETFEFSSRVVRLLWRAGVSLEKKNRDGLVPAMMENKFFPIREWTVMQTLASAGTIKRLGRESPLKCLPVELIRNVKEMLF